MLLSLAPSTNEVLVPVQLFHVWGAHGSIEEYVIGSSSEASVPISCPQRVFREISSSTILRRVCIVGVRSRLPHAVYTLISRCFVVAPGVSPGPRLPFLVEVRIVPCVLWTHNEHRNIY